MLDINLMESIHEKEQNIKNGIRIELMSSDLEFHRKALVTLNAGGVQLSNDEIKFLGKLNNLRAIEQSDEHKLDKMYKK